MISGWHGPQNHDPKKIPILLHEFTSENGCWMCCPEYEDREKKFISTNSLGHMGQT